MGKLKLKERYQGAALITGASAGLGTAFARQIAAEGIDLVLVARRKDRLESLAKELREKHAVAVHVIAADLSEADAPARIKRELDQAGVTVGLLVNNAGYGSHGFFHELDGANEARMVDLNCRAPVALCAAFVPNMVARRNGAVLFLASIGAYQPTPFFAVYGATKSFNLMLGEALWAELKQFGVDVIALSPGYTRTEFQEKAEVTNKAITGWMEADEVVARGLAMLGRKPSTVAGFLNAVLAWSIRFSPRAMAARTSYNLSRPKGK